MFQFRRFPTYTYFLQCTLHGYCPCGLPHSEIRGSRDICSSPRLIAACHVLHRLLMPRHSPCALFSLTLPLRALYHFPQRSCQRNFGSLKNYAGFTDSRNCNCHPASLQMLFHNYCFPPYGFPVRLPLCCLTSLALHCSVFKVRLQPFKVRNKLLIP